MSIYSLQKVFCNNCGKQFECQLANANWDGRVCSAKCSGELGIKKSCSIMGKHFEEQFTELIEKLNESAEN